MITKIKVSGKIQYLVTGVFGEGGSSLFEEAVSLKNADSIAIHDESPRLNKSLKSRITDAGGQEMFRYFNTRAEAKAYIKGVEDMDGWMGYAFTEYDDHIKVFGGHKIMQKNKI